MNAERDDVASGRSSICAQAEKEIIRRPENGGRHSSGQHGAHSHAAVNRALTRVHLSFAEETMSQRTER